MNVRSNWILFLVALGLAAYVMLVDRKAGVTVRGGAGASTYEPVDPGSVTAVELMRSNAVVRAEATNGTWRLVLPVAYPAQAASVEKLLAGLGHVVPSGFITPGQVAGQPDGLKSYGLEPPGATVTFLTAQGASIFRLGNLTPAGSHFYFQRVGSEGVYTAPVAILESVPSGADEWRDRTLWDLGGRSYDRVRLESKGRTVFEAVRDLGGWRLRQPLSARADGERIEAMLAQLGTVRVSGFVTDAAVIDRAAYGLQPPEFELSVGIGTNDLVRMQVGSMPTNAPGERFVRRLANTNVVRVAASDLEVLEHPLEDFRDPLVFGALGGVSALEVRGSNAFSLSLVGTNWFVTAPSRFPAEGSAVEFLLAQLAQLEIAQFVNDVVPDLAPYGLDRPGREFLALRGTNVLAHLQVGSPTDRRGTLLFARRTDEPGVYAIPRTVLFNLESAGQLRSWKFDPTNAVEIEVAAGGQRHVLVRQGGVWRIPGGPAFKGFLPDAVDEMLYRIGIWDSMRYAVTDEAALLRAGRFAEVSQEVRIRFGEGAPMKSLRLRFGAPLGANRFVLANFDEDPVALRLEMPAGLHADLSRYLGMP